MRIAIGLNYAIRPIGDEGQKAIAVLVVLRDCSGSPVSAACHLSLAKFEALWQLDNGAVGSACDRIADGFKRGLQHIGDSHTSSAVLEVPLKFDRRKNGVDFFLNSCAIDAECGRRLLLFTR